MRGPGPNIDGGIERFWRNLRDAGPAAVCAGTGASFHGGRYAIPFLGGGYSVDPAAGRIGGPPGDALPEDPEFQLLILGYLTLAGRGGRTIAQTAPGAADRWVSERQLPGGSLFFQGPHALPLAPLLRLFGQDAEGFRRACAALGGAPLAFGDAAFRFQALPLVPLAVILWVGDEEFPARAGVLFDPSVASHLPLDLILALVRAAILRIQAAASSTG